MTLTAKEWRTDSAEGREAERHLAGMWQSTLQRNETPRVRPNKTRRAHPEMSGYK